MMMITKTEADFESALAAAQTIKEATTALLDSRGGLEMARQLLLDEREAILSAPVSREDAKRFIFRSIDRIGAEFVELAGWDFMFERVAFPRGDGRKQGPRNDILKPTAKVSPLTLRDINQAEAGGQSAMCSVVGSDFTSFFFGNRDLSTLAPARVYFFFGDIIKQKIEENFESLFPQYVVSNATTVEQRRQTLDGIAQELERINSEIRTIDEQLDAIGAPSGNAIVTQDRINEDAAAMNALMNRKGSSS